MSRIMEDKKMAKYRKLGRTASQRKALLRNQVTMLLQHGKIRSSSFVFFFFPAAAVGTSVTG